MCKDKTNLQVVSRLHEYHAGIRPPFLHCLLLELLFCKRLFGALSHDPLENLRDYPFEVHLQKKGGNFLLERENDCHAQRFLEVQCQEEKRGQSEDEE
jgi:hypothetical protein